jgi:hypothetical protein
LGEFKYFPRGLFCFARFICFLRQRHIGFKQEKLEIEKKGRFFFAFTQIANGDFPPSENLNDDDDQMPFTYKIIRLQSGPFIKHTEISDPNLTLICVCMKQQWPHRKTNTKHAQTFYELAKTTQ